MTPFFSVVIDNHNYGRFLRAAIDGVLAQDFKDYELIVVDDGSTDDSREILASYGPRLRAVLQERQGQATAFNRGFSEARGEVVCLLDSDDVWRQGKLSAVAPLFDDPAVGAVEHYLQDVDRDLNPLRDWYADWPARYRLEDFLDGRTEFTATSGLAYRKKALTEIPKDLFYYLDDFLTVHALLRFEVANIRQVLGFHRVHGGNWCAGGYQDPRKLAVDFRMRGIFSGHLKRWLGEAGKSLTPRYLEIERLELLRRRVLYEALAARPAEAWAEWKRGAFAGSAAESRTLPLARFRLASLLVAVLSPSLYLALYSLYAKAAPLKTLRLRLFPESHAA